MFYISLLHFLLLFVYFFMFYITLLRGTILLMCHLLIKKCNGHSIAFMIVRFGVICGVIKCNEAEANDTQKTDI